MSNIQTVLFQIRGRRPEPAEAERLSKLSFGSGLPGGAEVKDALKWFGIGLLSAVILFLVGRWVISRFVGPGVLVFGYSLWLLRIRMGAKHAVCTVILLCYIACPYIIGYLGVVSKDCLYSVFVFLFFLCLLDDFLDPEAFRRSAGKNFLLIFPVQIIESYLYILTRFTDLATVFVGEASYQL